MTNLIEYVKSVFDFVSDNFDTIEDTNNYSDTLLRFNSVIKRSNLPELQEFKTITSNENRIYIVFSNSSIVIFSSDNLESISVYFKNIPIYSKHYNSEYLHQLFKSIDDLSLENIFYLTLSGEFNNE